MTNHLVIEKIKKLMALTRQRGATAGEADAAMNKIHSLLRINNLSLSEIDFDTENAKSTLVYRSPTGRRKENRTLWKHRVAYAMSKLYYCNVIKFINGYGFIGVQADVDIAYDSYLSLCEQCDNLKDSFLIRYKTSYPEIHKKLLRKYGNSYIAGLGYGLNKQIASILRQRSLMKSFDIFHNKLERGQTESKNGLMVIGEEETKDSLRGQMKDFLDKHNIKGKIFHSNVSIQHDIHDQGVIDSHKLRIYREIEESKGPTSSQLTSIQIQ